MIRTKYIIKISDQSAIGKEVDQIYLTRFHYRYTSGQMKLWTVVQITSEMKNSKWKILSIEKFDNAL